MPKTKTAVLSTVTSIIDQMTLDEKLAQLGSCWFFELLNLGGLDENRLSERMRHGIGQVTRLGGGSTQHPVEVARTANHIQRFLVENTRLRIPAIFHEECCSGAMVLGGSMFPQMLGLASSFNPGLAESMAGVIRQQLRAIGAQQGLAPVLDVGRDPRWGRIEETFGEDPTLVSQFGMAYVRGLQGADPAQGIAATAKHFIGHSMSQGGLNCGPVHAGMREMFDVYLGPFEAAIRDAGLATIMNAYPELDGEVVAASRSILTDLLRERLGFDGLVVSDYEAVIMLHNYHFVAETLQKAGRLAIEAGIDVELPTTVCYGEPLRAALEAGEVSLETIDTAVARHLQKKVEMGLLDNPFVDEGAVMEVFDTPDQRALARELAAQSMVLLKNNGLLPLKKGIATLAVIGPTADNPRSQLGDYTYAAGVEYLAYMVKNAAGYDMDLSAVLQQQPHVVSLLEGIRAAVSADTTIIHARGCDVISYDRSGFEEAVQAARAADAVVLALGDCSGLMPACSTGETRDVSDLSLPGVQQQLAEAVLATGKPVVAVLINGRPYAVGALAGQADAVLEAWLPGEEGGNAVADVLFGLVNPGGKLPITFPRSAGQTTIFYNHKPSGMKSNWYLDYVNEPVTPLYPFGHGLSYTRFEYSDLTISREAAGAGEVVDVSLKVTNTGELAGDEVIQLYIRDEYASLPRPVKELKGFVRASLAPGQSRTVVFHLPVDQLAFYDNDFNLILEPGTIKVMVGSSSSDIRLQGGFMISGDKNWAVQQRVFVCPVSLS